MYMKKFVLLTAVLALLASCGSGDRGELVGVKGKKWHPECFVCTQCQNPFTSNFFESDGRPYCGK